MYDVFILGLMIVGISGAVVFSYKIFHSRVYPVGIVRRMPTTQDEFEDATVRALSDFGTVLDPDDFKGPVIVEGGSDKDIVRDLFELHVKDARETWKVYTTRRLMSQSGRRQYQLALRHNLEQNPFRVLEMEGSPLEEEGVEHRETLKKRIEDIEKRIRRLEVKSVQERQEATEEKPQPPQVVH